MPRTRKQKVTARALLELKMAGDVQVAPDGKRVAFGVAETDWDGDRVVQHLYVAKVGDEDPPRQVTRGPSDEARPLWSPDGKWLAFLSAREDPEAGDEDDYDEEPKAQVWLLPMDGGGGEAEKLTDASEGVGDYDWLPDSSGLVYLAREPRRKPLQAAVDDKVDKKDDATVEHEEKFRQQIWQIGREDKKATRIHSGDYGIGEVAVSPDGNTIAFTTNYTGEVNDYHRADVWTVARATGETRQLTDGPGGKYHPVWRPDGREIVFVRSLDPGLSYSQENLFAVSPEGGAVRHLTAEFPHDLTDWHGVWWDAQGRLYISVALGTTTAIFRRDGEAAPFTPLIQDREHIHDFHVARDGGLAYVAGGADDAPEVYWLGPDASEAVALTDLNDDWMDKYALAPTGLVTWTAPDGLTIEGLLTYPTDYDPTQRYPLLLGLHGGPHGRVVQELTPYSTDQVYAAHGYAVLMPNYRGSEGYGEAFGTANRADLGGGDYQDIVAGVDWAIENAIADPERLGVSGSSYGGFLTNWAIGHTDRFKAAVSKFGIFSLVTDFSNSQAPRWEVEYLDGYYWDRAELYTRLSPSSYVQNIETPVLIMHGDQDPNTFFANSQEMYTALRLRGKPVQFVHYPREGHGFFEPQHRLDEVRRCLAWFDQYLKPDAKPSEARIGEKVVSDGWELTVVSAGVTTYAGRAEGEKRLVEAAFVLRDLQERKRSLTLGPAEVTLTRRPAGRPLRPVGLPLEVLGEKVLAEGSGWQFRWTPGKEEHGLAVPVALTFRIPDAAGTYALALKEFPSVIFDVPPAEAKDTKSEKDEEKPA